MGEYEETYIFFIYLIKRREIPRDTLGIWKSKGQCNPKVIWEKGRNFSSYFMLIG